MCGIYATNINQTESETLNKIESIKFRGPDHTGIKNYGKLILAHLRLAILDLDERSNQPFEYERLVIVFNGEIYNFEEIRQELVKLNYQFETTGDTEVLLKGFHCWGVNVVEKLNGMFAFVIYDKKIDKLYVFRDRLGVKPLYYYWNNKGEFEICSQLRPISSNKKINSEAISIFLDCGYIPSPYSIFEDVFKLLPGCYLEIDLKKNVLVENRYWDLQKQDVRNISYEKAKEQLHDLLIDAVKIRLNSDVPFGAFLSGGIDSAIVCCIAAKYGNNQLNTFSIGFEEKKYDESKIAKKYSEIIGSSHTETICKSEDFTSLISTLVSVYDEPFADSSALPSLLLNKVTKSYVTMALSGDGGDESFLGYNHFTFVERVGKYFKLPKTLRQFFKGVFSNDSESAILDRINKLVSMSEIEDLIIRVFIGNNTLLLKRDLKWLKHYSKYLSLSENSIQKTADLNIKLWLENDSNVKVDRASMAYSIEVRSPFLDYRIIEFARTLPVDYKFDTQTKVKKKILRDILKEYIPEDIFNQPKKGFSVPLESWIRGELKQEFEDIFKDKYLDIIPNFNKEKFKKIFKEHLDGKKNNKVFIWRVFILLKWYKEFKYI